MLADKDEFIKIFNQKYGIKSTKYAHIREKNTCFVGNIIPRQPKQFIISLKNSHTETHNNTIHRAGTDTINDANLDKFNNENRKLVVSELEKKLRIKLIQDKTYRSLFIAQNVPYLIFGGKGDWHGVKCIDFLCDKQNTGRIAKEGAIIIAKKYTNRFEIYQGDLSLLFGIKNIKDTTMSEQYEFNLEQR